MTDYLLVLIGRVAPAFRQVLISGRGRAIGMIIADGDIAVTANARLLAIYGTSRKRSKKKIQVPSRREE